MEIFGETVTIQMDGNKIHIMWGENIQEAINGFGDSIPEALIAFANDWEQIRGSEIFAESEQNGNPTDSKGDK